MSQGLPLPYPFPQPITNGPAQYTTVKTYPVLYGQVVYLLFNDEKYVVGSRSSGNQLESRSPGASSRIPADSYIILNHQGLVPRDPHQRALPVKYGDSIQLRNDLTGDFWRIENGVLYATGPSVKSGSSFKISSSDFIDGNAISAYVTNTFPRNYPQVNRFELSYGRYGIYEHSNTVMIGNQITSLSFVLGNEPSISSGGRASRDIITASSPPGPPSFYIAPFQPASLSRILPSTMSYQYPSSRIYDGPYYPPYGDLVPKGYY